MKKTKKTTEETPGLVSTVLLNRKPARISKSLAAYLENYYKNVIKRPDALKGLRQQLKKQRALAN